MQDHHKESKAQQKKGGGKAAISNFFEGASWIELFVKPQSTCSHWEKEKNPATLHHGRLAQAWSPTQRCQMAALKLRKKKQL